jgi:twitching motility protein PilT
MQTFDQALFGHVKSGLVNYEDALEMASSPHDFKLLMQSDGRVATTMEDVAVAQSHRSDSEPPPPPVQEPSSVPPAQPSNTFA